MLLVSPWNVGSNLSSGESDKGLKLNTNFYFLLQGRAMERLLQGPINPSFHDDLVAGFMNNAESSKFEEEEEGEAEPNYSSSTASLDDNMPFLQMLLQSVEAPQFFPLSEPNFQTLLRLQHLKNKPWNGEAREIENPAQVQALELESCVTQDVTEELHSTRETQQLPRPSAPAARERRKRKRQKPTKNKEEVESQRMTHIAVERNRRRQMNDHLNALRSLMPTSYVHRGDQASIIGGAIDFVKELEQLLYSLESQKRTRWAEEENSKSKSKSNSAGTPNSLYASLPRYSDGSSSEAAVRAEKKSEAADIEVTVIQDHVNLKVECRRRSGQLVRAIVGLEEELRLTVLHLNITSSQDTVLYSFNLKREEDCGLGSVEEIATAVQQMFGILHDEIQNSLS